MDIREAIENDAAQIAELLDQMGYALSREHVAGALVQAKLPPGTVLVAEQGDRCLGFAAYQIVYFIEDAAPRCRLTAIGVDDSARETGVGRKLLAEVEERAARVGCTAVEATSSSRRKAAHRFYPALGYVDGTTEKVFYVKPLNGFLPGPRIE
jgi:GNAT superfamily N-acetyltransferase